MSVAGFLYMANARRPDGWLVDVIWFLSAPVAVAGLVLIGKGPEIVAAAANALFTTFMLIRADYYYGIQLGSWNAPKAVPATAPATSPKPLTIPDGRVPFDRYHGGMLCTPYSSAEVRACGTHVHLYTVTTRLSPIGFQEVQPGNGYEALPIASTDWEFSTVKRRWVLRGKHWTATGGTIPNVAGIYITDATGAPIAWVRERSREDGDPRPVTLNEYDSLTANVYLPA